MIKKYGNTSAKPFIWIIVILIILNVSTVGTILYRNYRYKHLLKMDKKCFPVQHKPHFFKFNATQNDSHFTEHSRLMSEFRNEARDLATQMQEKRQEILSQLSAEKVDTNYLEQLANEFGDLHKELKLCTINFYLKTKAVSSPEEQEQLYHYFNYLLKKGDMHGRHFMKPHEHMKKKDGMIDESTSKSHFAPKSSRSKFGTGPKGDFQILLNFNVFPLGIRAKKH